MKVAIVILCIFVVGLTGYIVYDKVLNNDNNKNLENTNQDRDGVVDNDDNSTDKQNSSKFTNNCFSAKYKNISDNKSYIVFKEDGTFEAIQNQCEGYSKLSGTFIIENGEIILTSDNFYTKKNVLNIESNDENAPILLFDKDGAIANCSEQGYYVIEK